MLLVLNVKFENMLNERVLFFVIEILILFNNFMICIWMMSMKIVMWVLLLFIGYNICLYEL